MKKISNSQQMAFQFYSLAGASQPGEGCEAVPSSGINYKTHQRKGFSFLLLRNPNLRLWG